MARKTYRFEDFELSSSHYRLRRAGKPVPLEPRALDLLTFLIEHRDRVASKTEILDSIWGDQFVSEAALTTTIRAARQALGDSGSAQRLIRTAHGRGYQFVGQVAVVAGDGGARPKGSASVGPTLAHPPSSADQVIRSCQAGDGTRIAYATLGTGPPLMKAANWMTHLDLEWVTPVWSHWLAGLARDRMLIRYDERGCGLSDWDVPSFNFDDWVDDLETVVDAIGLDRFPLLGVSQGGAVAIAYAVRHPERVSKLILAGAYARGRYVRATDDAQRAEAALDLDLARVGWARADPSYLQVFASQFLPDGTPQEWDEFTRFLRSTTSPMNAIRFLEVFAHIDISDIASQVRCPTLILQSRNDVRVPTAQAMELAASIPDSRLVLLDSANHLLSATEPAWPEFLSQIDAFLAE